jgi:CheY-like chemotaxis protein/anti-sigma regulatory factor (Ser/Thr protein kinase)
MLIEDADEMKPEDMVPDLEKIYRAGQHLLELINDILDLSKIEAGRMGVYLEDVQLQDLVQQVVDTGTPLFVPNDNRLEVVIADEIPVMFTDVTKLRQMLLNLLSNAAKFTKAGVVRLDVSVVDGRVRFAVSDTGVGMTEEQMSRVFEIFAQGDSSTTREYGGTGLGLTITRRFCELLGGDIRVESEVGKGSTFVVELPVRAPTRSSASAPSGSGVPTRHRSDTVGAITGTILVIDDDEAILDIVSATLTRAGFDVVCARNGEDGLRLAAEVMPIAITLDIVMQGMDGWHVLTKLKASPELRDIPVVLMTITPDRDLGMALGAAEFVTKPVDRAHLISVIRSHCGGDPSPELLIVEDDPKLQALLSRTIVKQGWRSRIANNGQEALDLLEQGLPQLILLDLMMPVMDGFELLAHIRMDVRFRDIPVVVVTAKELDAEDRARLEGNVSKILQKGAYKRDALMGEIRRLIAHSTGIT